MYLKVSIPGKIQLKLVPTLQNLLFLKSNEIHYIGGADVLPPPLKTEEESDCISMLATEDREDARATCANFDRKSWVRCCRLRRDLSQKSIWNLG